MDVHPFGPTSSIGVLRQRARILRNVRAFFDGLGFFEVQTPTLSAETMIDIHIDPVSVSALSLKLGSDREPDEMYLQSSPEFAMKRLLVAGADAIYQMGPAFRAGESGGWHNPEFTILEWYRTGDSFEDGIALLDSFTQAVVGTEPCARLTYREAMIQFADIDPLEASIEQLCQTARSSGTEFHEESFATEDDLLNLIFDTLVSPNLGLDRPTILTHYPRSQAALAKISPDDPRVAERFELFIDGIELANGYGELLDADELLRRCQRNNQVRIEQGKPALPMPKRLLAAMRSGLPACSGCALGIDRMVAVMLGESEIPRAIAFPIDRA